VCTKYASAGRVLSRAWGYACCIVKACFLAGHFNAWDAALNHVKLILLSPIRHLSLPWTAQRLFVQQEGVYLAADKVWIIGIKQVQRSMGQKLFDAECQSCSKTRHLRKCSHCKVIACCSLACTDHQKCGMHVLSDLEQYQCPLSCSRALMQSSLALSKSD